MRGGGARRAAKQGDKNRKIDQGMLFLDGDITKVNRQSVGIDAMEMKAHLDNLKQKHQTRERR